MRLNEGEHIISGIHNYCDRWCERCTLSNRCAIYDGSYDADKEDFVTQLANTFAETLLMLEEIMKEHGVSMPTPEESRAFEEQQAKNRLEIKKHPLQQASFEYINLARAWDKSHQSDLEAFSQELSNHLDMGIEQEDTAIVKLDEVAECIEIYRWYLYLINVKFSRALNGKIYEADDDDDDDYPKDSDGSAKVALLAAERSLQAWVKLYQTLPHLSDSILPMMAKLHQCIKLGDATFVNARDFVRPGFDEKL
jgi:hypothetical protein